MNGTELLTAGLFLGVVLVTVAITFWASRQTTGTSNFYAGGDSSAGSRTAWPSRVTTCRPRRSSASPG